jgi:hypothetical protein
LLSDALDSCQKQVGQHYLEYQAQAIRSATRWQEAEAALFALRFNPLPPPRPSLPSLLPPPPFPPIRNDAEKARGN